MLKLVVGFFFLFLLNANAQFTQTVVSITGLVSDSEANKELSGWVILKNPDGKILTKARANGKYFITGLKPGEQYILEVQIQGYFQYNFDLNVPNTDKYQEISRDFAMKPMVEGAKIRFSVIPFDIKNTKLRDGAGVYLDEYVKILRANPRAEFAIEVYPENQSNSNNLEFTKKRAEELKNYFVQNKIKTEIEIKPNQEIDVNNPPPSGKQAKGKRYKGSIYLVVNKL
jgi:outer membrane protein OmpA-like peptidoglycan-associated protein